MSAGKNKTLYVREEDQEVWEKAKKYLQFYEDLSLSEFVTEHLRTVVAKYEALDVMRGEGRA